MTIGQIATFFELSVGCFIEFIAILIFARYRQRKNRNALLLFFFILLSGIGVLCSFIARLLVNYLGFLGTENYIVYMFVQDHFALIFVTLALFALHLFAGEVFGIQKATRRSIIVGIMGAIFVVFLFLAPLFISLDLDIIAYLLVFFYCFFVCIPIITQSKRAQQQVEDPVYRAAFASARYMSYCYMLLLLMFAGDQTMISISTSLQFNVFYWAGWIFAIVTALFGYLGFVLPNWFKKLMSYSRKGTSGKEMTAESASSE